MDTDHKKLMADTDEENRRQVSYGEGVPPPLWAIIVFGGGGIALIVWAVIAKVLS